MPLSLQNASIISVLQTQNILKTSVQCWTNVEDVGPTLYKCFKNVLCLPGDRVNQIKLQLALKFNKLHIPLPWNLKGVTGFFRNIRS